MHRNLEKKKIQNTSKGITLIALVITIIVLLILAGVAINMAIDSNGLFGKANEAVEGWNTAVRNEETAITNLLEMANSIGGTTGGGNGGENDDNPPTLPAGWDSAKVGSTVTETSTITGTNKERVVPIPVGFTASQIGGDVPENTIAGGLVIYQIPEGATVDWTNSQITLAGESTEKVLQEEANQYVWIPVDDINQMVMCKSNNKDADSDGNKICNVEFVNGVLQCTNTGHTTNATNLCGRLYGTDNTTNTSSPYIYTTHMNFANRTQTWTDNSGYREPDIVSSKDTDDTTGGLTAFTAQMTNDFVNMATSVAKYGGFYVSRYEAGVDGASLKNQVVITSAGSDSTVRKGLSNWYGLYNAVRKEITVGTSTMQSHMIYGSQYDQIINFIGSEAQTGHTDRQLTTQGLTGSNGNDIMNNIFDLEGNNMEWTAQASYTLMRGYRGGYYVLASLDNFYPASYSTSYSPVTTTDYYTTRPSLYL